MPFEKLIDGLPELYLKFLPDFFKESIPSESFATCSNCAMLCKEPKENAIQQPFSPNSKCCTYHPRLPNYLIGGLLKDTNPMMNEGRNRIREKIKKGIGVYPSGIYPSQKYDLLYEKSQAKGFGRNLSLICPYFNVETGNCTIWKFREAVCSTYFCKTIANKVGKEFWEAVKNYLFTSQINLSNYTLDKLDVMFFEDNINKTLSIEDLDDQPINLDERKKIWEGWTGKEEEFYISTFELIENLSQDEFNNICGINGNIMLKKIIQTYSKVVGIPDRLIINPLNELRTIDDNSYLVHLISIDVSFKMPQIIFTYFDGHLSYDQIINDLQEREGIEIERDLIIALYHNNILIEAK